MNNHTQVCIAVMYRQKREVGAVALEQIAYSCIQSSRQPLKTLGTHVSGSRVLESPVPRSSVYIVSSGSSHLCLIKPTDIALNSKLF